MGSPTLLELMDSRSTPTICQLLQQLILSSQLLQSMMELHQLPQCTPELHLSQFRIHLRSLLLKLPTLSSWLLPTQLPQQRKKHLSVRSVAPLLLPHMASHTTVSDTPSDTQLTVTLHHTHTLLMLHQLPMLHQLLLHVKLPSPGLSLTQAMLSHTVWIK